MRSRFAVAVSLLAVALAACSGRREKPAAETPAAAPARTVATTRVERVAGGETSVAGVVRARQRASLAARVTASVVELPYREGAEIAEGAVVVRLDESAQRASVGAAEAALNAAAADLRRVEALLQKGAATPREREDAEARAAAGRAGLESARDQLSYAVLRAPFAGRLAARLIDVGDVVSPGVPLVEIEGGAGLEVVAGVDAALASALVVGTTLSVEVDGQPAALTARVTAASPAADSTTHRFEVRAQLQNAPGLRSGLFARLLVPAAGAQPRLVVPNAVLVHRGGLTGVFVVDGTLARLRWVAAGRAEGERTEVRAGLEAGERVVLDPGDLTDGAAVSEKP